MKLAIYHNQQSGGARRALLGFCAELQRRHQLHLFTLASADREMLLDEAVVERVTRLPFAPRPPVRFGLYLNDAIRRRNLDALAWVNQAAAGLIDAGTYDAVLVDADRFTFAPYVLRYLRTPTVHYVHHRPWHPQERVAAVPASIYQRARRLWHAPLERRLTWRRWRDEVTLIRKATRVVTNSRFNAGRLASLYSVGAAVIPPGVDLPALTNRGQSGFVLSVGELELRKGFDFLVEALAQMPAAIRPPLHIVANGGNPDVRRGLERRARERQVNLRIEIMPPQVELARAYRDASLFVFGAREEALGLAPLEAMAHGLPVVAVAEGGVSETVINGETGFLTRRDADEFAARVSDLLSAPALRASMAAAARAAVERGWTWPRRAQALEAELEKVRSVPSSTLAHREREAMVTG